jgi:hypothetical protein
VLDMDLDDLAFWINAAEAVAEKEAAVQKGDP